MKRLYIRQCPGCGKVFGAREVPEKAPLPDWRRRVECSCGFEPGTLWHEAIGFDGLLVIWAEGVR